MAGCSQIGGDRRLTGGTRVKQFSPHGFELEGHALPSIWHYIDVMPAALLRPPRVFADASLTIPVTE